jgi:3-oxoacyl-[acyl-carrier-protein] synthase-1
MLKKSQKSLKQGKSGITYSAAQEEIGMRSWVSGKPNIDLSEHIDRKQWRFMGDAAGYAFLSMEQAIADSGLTPEQVSNVRTGIIAGSGGASSASQVEAADILRERGLRRVGSVPRHPDHGQHRVCVLGDTVSN